MIQTARALMEGIDPPGLDGSADYAKLCSDERIVPVETPWQSVAEYS